MNERIRELYLQAHSVRHYDDDPSLAGNPPTVYWQGEVSAQKFAELIVRECADLFEVEWGEEKLTGNDVGYVVKKHFGVEE